MFKKIISCIIILTLISTLFSCRKEIFQEGDVKGKDSDKAYRIGLITDTGGIRDRGFNQNAWMGVKKFSKENPDVAVEFVESKIEEDYDINVEYLARHKLDLVIGVGYKMAESIRIAATELPNQKFAIIDDDSNKNLSNVSCIMFKQEQAAYLAGIVAGLMTKTNYVGYIQGDDSDVMDLFGIGFVYGVKSINPKTQIIQFNANTFNDRSLGYKLANKLIQKYNTDIIFHAAGATGIGIIEACKENKRYAIGVDTDQSVMAPKTVLTSAVKKVDVAIYDICNKVINDEVEGGVYTYSIENEGVDIAPTVSLLPDSVLEEVNNRRKAIKEGRIIVPTKKENCPGFNLEDFTKY